MPFSGWQFGGVDCTAFITGKFCASVLPVTTALPAASTAMPPLRLFALACQISRIIQAPAGGADLRYKCVRARDSLRTELCVACSAARRRGASVRHRLALVHPVPRFHRLPPLPRNLASADVQTIPDVNRRDGQE